MGGAVKHTERSAAIAFSQNHGYLAAGTMAGAIDLTFSTSSVLEVRPSKDFMKIFMFADSLLDN